MTNPGVWPCLTYRDAPAAIAFLTDVLGFTLTARYPAEGDVEHAELRWPEGGGVMLGSPKPGRATGGLVYVVTQDPDGVHDRAVAAGATISRALHETDYGSRDVAVRDPEGVEWSFGTYAGE